MSGNVEDPHQTKIVVVVGWSPVWRVSPLLSVLVAPSLQLGNEPTWGQRVLRPDRKLDGWVGLFLHDSVHSGHVQSVQQKTLGINFLSIFQYFLLVSYNHLTSPSTFLSKWTEFLPQFCGNFWGQRDEVAFHVVSVLKVCLSKTRTISSSPTSESRCFLQLR